MAGTRPGHDGVGSRDTCCKTRSAPLPSSKRWRNRPRTPSSSCPGARRRSFASRRCPGHPRPLRIKRRTSDGPGHPIEARVRVGITSEPEPSASFS